MNYESRITSRTKKNNLLFLIHNSPQGFTLTELMLVIGIFAILTSLISLNLIRPQTKASVETTTTTLISDLKEQQIRAMIGDSQGAPSAQAHGIYFESESYTLFRGSSYTPSDPTNFTVNLEGGATLSSSFSSSQIVFLRRSGEVSEFTPGSNTIVVQHSTGDDQNTISVNRYGVVSIN